MTEQKYWINTVHRDHVLAGKAGGFVQAGHGKRSYVARLNAGDLLIFYSPRRSFDDKTPLQRFTAVVRITDEEIYQGQMLADFKPFRRNATYLPCQETEIRPLLDQLDFIENKRQWGFPFRRGLFEISRKDFEIIARAMKVESLPA